MSLSHDWLLAGLFALERLWKTKAFWFTWKLNNLPFFVLVTCWSAVLDRVPTMHLFTFSAELEQPQQTVTIRSKLSHWDFCRILSYGPGCRWQLIQILKCSFVCFRRGWLKIIQFWSRHEQESRHKFTAFKLLWICFGRKSLVYFFLNQQCCIVRHVDPLPAAESKDRCWIWSPALFLSFHTFLSLNNNGWEMFFPVMSLVVGLISSMAGKQTITCWLCSWLAHVRSAFERLRCRPHSGLDYVRGCWVFSLKNGLSLCGRFMFRPPGWEISARRKVSLSETLNPCQLICSWPWPLTPPVGGGQIWCVIG